MTIVKISKFSIGEGSIETHRDIIEIEYLDSERYISPDVHKFTKNKGNNCAASGLKPIVIDLRYVDTRIPILSSRTFAEKKSKMVINMSKLKSFILDNNTEN